MAVMPMQRISIYALKNRRKQILELIQRRGAVEIEAGEADETVFRQTDTAPARARFENNTASLYAALEALDKLAPGYTIYNNETVGELVLADRRAMSFVTIILAPIIEETLVRGLVFGSLHRTSRWLAYIVSCFLFVFMHNWQYFALYPAGSVLLSCVPYIPAAVALGWVYEKSSTIWAPITLHALINAMSVGVLTLS